MSMYYSPELVRLLGIPEEAALATARGTTRGIAGRYALLPGARDREAHVPI